MTGASSVPDELIAQSTEVIQFYTREALMVHASLDRLGIPRLHLGENLSMSQRVMVAVGMAEGMIEALGGTPRQMQ